MITKLPELNLSLDEHAGLLLDYAKLRQVVGPDLHQLNAVCPRDLLLYSPQIQVSFHSNSFYEGPELPPKPADTEFLEPVSPLKGSTTDALVQRLRRWRKLGRVRFMRLQPRGSLSWHSDPELHRLHFPLVTNSGAFFIFEDAQRVPQVKRMDQPGHAYLLRSRSMHMAVNGSRHHDRVHLLFNLMDED